MKQLTQLEKDNRKRLIDKINQIPIGAPIGWECNLFAVGGLMYVGFSEIQPEKLICISSQGQSIIDCKTLKKIYCDEIYDEDNLIACVEELGDEMIRIAGDCGGGLRRCSDEGNILELIAPFWPKEQIIFMPNFYSWHSEPNECQIVFEGYEIKAYGFSKCGNYFVIASSSDLAIFRNEMEIRENQ